MNSNQLRLAKREYFIKANGGISLPIAGFVYWLSLGICGFFVSNNTWSLIAFFTSGLIFPLGILLSKPLKSNILAKGPLSTLIMPAIAAMFLSWPMIIAGYITDVHLTPLLVAIGMSLHWPVIGWVYGSKVCLAHAILRGLIVTLLWFSFPELRFITIPWAVSIIYLITVLGLKKEVQVAKKVINIETK